MKIRVRAKRKNIVKCVLFYVFTSCVTIFAINWLSNRFHENKDYFERLVQNKYLMSEQTKIDWHNYTQISLEKIRTGPGEQGRAADISNIPKDVLDRTFAVNGYNGALSDIVSLFRAVPDTRPPNCSKILYRKNLPSASIIVPFHNEHLSMILRTIWSMLKRAPDQLIKDFILVDDFSDREELKDGLDEYIKENFQKVKLIRLKKRSGLITARQEGAKAAEGDVLIFIDAHCEANVNWLPPLLDLIADDYRTCVCPFIDAVNNDDMQYYGAAGGRGGFTWELVYDIFYKFTKYGDESTEPFESPVQAGGLFAISAKFFWELGGYDEGIRIWGGEQFELSFKIWQCGGRQLDVPCSRFGHMYRKHWAASKSDVKDYYCSNLRRVAEVWMDEYKEYFYKRMPDCINKTYGDISKQLAIRDKLNCKPFKWFLEEVAYDVTARHPVVDPPDVAYGEIRNIGAPDYCIQTTHDKAGVILCSTGDWSLTVKLSWRGEMKHEFSSKCWETGPETNGNISVVLSHCHFLTANQLWTYDEEKKTIFHKDTNKCLDMDAEKKSIFLTSCQSGAKTQQWKLHNFNKNQQDKIKDYIKTIHMDEKPKLNYNVLNK